MNVNRLQALRALLLAGVVSLVSAPALAEPVQFDIPAEDLRAALLAFSKQSKMRVTVSPDVRDRQAPALRGTHEPLDALKRLLGEDLAFELLGPGNVVVRPGRSSSLAPATPVRAAAEAPPEELLVTGSRIRGAVPTAPVIRLTQEQIRDAGLVSLGDVIRAIPQNFVGGQNPGLSFNLPASVGGNIGSASALNLRGLGADATLTLINGHRLAYGGSLQSIDVSFVPLDALSRFEIVADGASAIYGSDAVAGVANIVLKRDYDGVAVRTRFGTSTDGGGFQQQNSIVGGTTWATGGFILAYDYERDTAILSRQRDEFAGINPGLVLYPELKHHNALFSGHQDISDALHLSLDMLYNWRRDFRAYQLDTTATPVGFAYGTRSQAFSIAPSLTWDVAGDWKASVIGTYGIDRVFWGQDMVLAGVVTPILRSCDCNTGKSAEVNADGSLFALAGGNAKLAVGAGYRSNRYRAVGSLGDAQRIDVQQDAYFGFAELNLPFVSAAQRIPFVNQLNFSAAVRYEDYPGVDQVATPKFGAIWSPSANFDLKASWGKSFKAPTLYQRYRPQLVANYAAATLGGVGFPADSTALFLIGGRSTLKPEHATTWSVSATAHPTSLGGARLEVSYFNVDYTDRVVYPLALVRQALSTPAYRSFIRFNPSPAEVAAALAGKTFYNLVAPAFDPSKVISIADNRAVNTAAQSVHGIDIAAELPFELGRYGSLSFSADASLLFIKQQNTPDEPFVGLTGTLFNPAHLRARGGVTWTQDALTLSSFVNYTGGVSDVRYVPNPRIGSMTTADATLRYAVPLGPFRTTEITLAAQNIFNAKPDLIQVTTPAQAAFDSTNYSVIGRFVSLGIAVHW